MSAILQAKTIKDAIAEAKEVINLERSGEITGLYTRFNKLNTAMLKHWRFATVNVIAGMSGSGKSALLNMLEQDFVNPLLNPAYQDKLLILAFKYEMTASDEILRSVSGKIKRSYAWLLSSEYRYTDISRTNGDYNKVTDEEFEKIEKILNTFESLPILFFETAGDLNQMYLTTKHYRDKYPKHKIVTTLDHTLLSRKLSERDDMELIANTAHYSAKMKKEFGIMQIFVSQLNGEIEKITRKENPSFHFPVKSDIHGSNQLFWACDSVAIFHRPSQIGIAKYGVNGLDTKIKMGENQSHDLIHYSIIKGRKNLMGTIWMMEKFSEGGLVEINPTKPNIFST